MKYLDDDSFKIAFGQNLRKLRKAKGFTQEELANELDTDISQISRIERGFISTSITTVNSIAKALKIPLSELFTW